MAFETHKWIRWTLTTCFVCISVNVSTQQLRSYPSIPDKFSLDKEFAAKLRGTLFRNSEEPTARYEVGQRVLDRLGKSTANTALRWTLRITANNALNAYSSPDGIIFIDQPLAELLGDSPGMWAAALAHEVTHVVRRDWALRYLFEHSIHSENGAVFDASGNATTNWVDGNRAAEQLASFARDLEMRADAEGMQLMARAGYHPDFMAALQHAISARMSAVETRSSRALHPEWHERERAWRAGYVAATREFDQLWPEWYASPGGNPPVVVFSGEPVAKVGASRLWEVHWPIRCQNLSGSVQVILRVGTPKPITDRRDDEMRQATGCTSEKTIIHFTVPAGSDGPERKGQADLLVVSDEGMILSRAIIARRVGF